MIQLTLKYFIENLFKLEPKFATTVFASNFANFSKNSSAEIFVQVIDVNDNAPEFEFPMSEDIYESVEILESVPIGSLVGKIYAFDKDTTHEKITFRSTFKIYSTFKTLLCWHSNNIYMVINI